MWRQIFCPGSDASGVAPSPLGGSGSFSPLGPSRGRAAGIFSSTQCQHYFILETPLPLGVLGLNAFSHPWTFQVSYVFPSPSSGPSSCAQVSGRTCQWSTQIFDSGGTMLDGGSLASHSSQHVGGCSLVVSNCKRSHHGCFSRPGTQGSAISAFNPLAAQQCVLCRQGFSSSVCQVVAGATQMSTLKVYQQCWKEWASWCA